MPDECYQQQLGADSTYCFVLAGSQPCQEPTCLVIGFLEAVRDKPWPQIEGSLSPEDFALSLICPMSSTSVTDTGGLWLKRTGNHHIPVSQYWQEIILKVYPTGE